MMGATGTGKTSIAIVTTIYHLYLLSCLMNPQALYGFPKATSIVFAIMGAKPRVVNKVIYLPMRKLIENMPYFQKHFMPDKLIESEMYFAEKNIRIAQAGGDEDAILGEAIIGGIITSTLLTLVVVPVIYSYLVRDRKPAAAPQPARAEAAELNTEGQQWTPIPRGATTSSIAAASSGSTRKKYATHG